MLSLDGVEVRTTYEKPIGYWYLVVSTTICMFWSMYVSMSDFRQTHFQMKQHSQNTIQQFLSLHTISRWHYLAIVNVTHTPCIWLVSDMSINNIVLDTQTLLVNQTLNPQHSSFNVLVASPYQSSDNKTDV